MKIRPLPETDLARFAPLPSDRKRNALEGFRLGCPPYSYDPVRSSLPDILDIKAELFDVPRPPWERVAEGISKRSRNSSEELANLQVAEGLYNYAGEAVLRGRKHEFLPLALGVGHKVVYWHSLF